MLKKLNKIGEYLLIVFSAYLLIFTNYHYLLVLPFLFYFVLFQYMHKINSGKKLEIPEYLFSIGIALVYFSLVGDFFFEFYNHIPYYDKLLHFIVPLFMAVILRYFITNIHYEKTMTMFTVMGMCAIWELFEYSADICVGHPLMQGTKWDISMNGGLIDTMQDIFFDLAGSIVGVFLKRQQVNGRKTGAAR